LCHAAHGDGPRPGWQLDGGNRLLWSEADDVPFRSAIGGVQQARQAGVGALVPLHEDGEIIGAGTDFSGGRYGHGLAGLKVFGVGPAELDGVGDVGDVGGVPDHRGAGP